jgi:hypothetical protein
VARYSTIPEAQDRIETLLLAAGLLRADGGPMPISVGAPPGGPQAEHVWIEGGVDDWAQTWETTGLAASAAREERYTVSVYVLILRAGDDYKAPRDKCFAVAAALEEALRGDPALAGSGAFQAELSSGAFGEAIVDGARYVALEIRVAVLAYLA